MKLGLKPILASNKDQCARVETSAVALSAAEPVSLAASAASSGAI